MSPPSATGRFGAATRGEASVIGVVLLLGLTVLGTTAVIALGSVVLEDTEHQSELQRAEHAMAQFDSRAAQVALGDSETQVVDFPGGDGSYSVVPSAGQITITHENYDESGSDEVLYNGTLGAVVYRNGDSVVAYQGGGVWRQDGSGRTRIVSPPEFHYRQGTLTLPVIQVTDGSGGAGSVSAVIQQSSPLVVQYPDRNSYYNNDPGNRAYRNPLAAGNVTVTVQSEFYEGWAKYFRERTTGNVTTNPGQQEVTLKLTTLGLTGEFGMPNDQSNGGGSVRVQGMDAGHSLTDFTITIAPKTNQESGFKNLRWSMFVEKGQQKFEIALRSSGTVGCGGTIDLHIYYSSTGHDSYQGWSGTVPVDCVNTDDDAPLEARISLNLTDPNHALTYGTVDPSDLAHFNNDFNKNDLQNPGTFSAHPDAINNHDALSYNVSETTNISFVVNHYFAELGPTFDLRIADQQSGGGAGVDEDASEGVIFYEGGSRVVTYLHITENHIEVWFR